MKKLEIGAAVRFGGELTGEGETKLKEVLNVSFTQYRAVVRAYLAILLYSADTPYSEGLCIAFDSLAEQANVLEVVEAAAREFHKMFNRAQALDILPVNAEQEQRLAAVCKPFYTRDA